MAGNPWESVPPNLHKEGQEWLPEFSRRLYGRDWGPMEIPFDFIHDAQSLTCGVDGNYAVLDATVAIEFPPQRDDDTWGDMSVTVGMAWDLVLNLSSDNNATVRLGRTSGSGGTITSQTTHEVDSSGAKYLMRITFDAIPYGLQVFHIEGTGGDFFPGPAATAIIDVAAQTLSDRQSFIQVEKGF